MGLHPFQPGLAWLLMSNFLPNKATEFLTLFAHSSGHPLATEHWPHLPLCWE